MLEKEFQYYKDHQEELVKKYNGKVIVIIGEKVVGVFDNNTQAYLNASEKYAAGTYLIQLVAPGQENYTATFHSRVEFH